MKWPFKTLRKSFPICPTSRAAMSIFQVCVSQSTFLGVTAWIPLALLHTFHTKWCSGNTDTMLHLLANPLSSLWGQEKGTTEDEMAGWHDWLDERESEWTPGVGDGQGGLACCDSWGRKQSDTTERLKWTELNWRDSAIPIHESTLPQPPFPSRLAHNIEQSSMCHTIGLCWLSIWNITVCTWPAQTP